MLSCEARAKRAFGSICGGVLRSSINCSILSAKHQGWESDPWKIDDSFPHTYVHLKRAWVLILREYLEVRCPELKTLHAYWEGK